jgi:hypothetical protein
MQSPFVVWSNPTKGDRVQYILLIYSNEDGDTDGTDDEDVLRRYGAFTQEVRDGGKLVASDRLQPTSAATTLRIRNGEALITDGPFAETKEQLGGYYVLECENIDEALAYAAKIPAAERGSIEVRPVWAM